MFQFLLAISASMVFSLAWSHQVQRPAVPKYSFGLDENRSQISEGDVRLLFDIVENEFKNEIGNSTESIAAGFNWRQVYLGAGTLLKDGNFTVMLWGGLVRASYMNYGVLSAVLCHEVGHRLAGYPRQVFQGEEHWSSAEGQSDHFAATVCLPRVYRQLLKSAPKFLQQELEPASRSVCQNSLSRAQCEWIATSGIDMIQFLQVYYELEIPLADPNATTSEVVSETLIAKYPSYQCRMDIFKEGSKCRAGLRCPRLPCWYKSP